MDFCDRMVDLLVRSKRLDFEFFKDSNEGSFLLGFTKRQFGDLKRIPGDRDYLYSCISPEVQWVSTNISLIIDRKSMVNLVNYFRENRNKWAIQMGFKNYIPMPKFQDPLDPGLES